SEGMVIPKDDDPIEEADDESDEGINYDFEEESNGHKEFRIPSIVKSTDQKLLASPEPQKIRSNDDSEDIETDGKNGEDNGEMGGDMITIWDDGLNTCGNPVPIDEQETGRIHLLLTWNHGDDRWGDLTNGTGKDTSRVFYTWSDDEGQTWE